MNRLHALGFNAFAAMAAFAIGVATSELVRGAARLFEGDNKVMCIDSGVCVGDAWPSSAVNINNDEHGLTALFCYRSDSKGEFLFLQDIIDGKMCKTLHYAVELRNPTYRTMIEVRSGKVVSITNGPLHVLDL